ncbi:hypothetical protein [Sphingobacterium faecium]|uniref:hypothetical protein n=1 Tax=Sphingobacterium faecium TaxID=34087 RepID=UPI003208C518
MEDLQDKVWYACYGSNLLEEHFLCYIKGGQPAGAKTVYGGCLDKTIPSENEDMYINSELYFARASKNWDNGGVAFIRTTFSPTVSTMGRIYLITKGQLIDIVKQETNTVLGLELDFTKAIQDGSHIFKEKSGYGNLLYIGQQKDYPIFTLTDESDNQMQTKPSADYLKAMCQGIKQTHGFDDLTILDYLKNKRGIIGNYTDEELMQIITEQ